jgi:CBS-domain-containing membrane protein
MNDLTTPLQTFRFPVDSCIAQAAPAPASVVTLASPALAVMTDLTRVKAAVIAPTLSLAEARQTMMQQGVRLLFVVEHMPCILGLITSTDLDGDRPLQQIARRGVVFAELTVQDVMTGLPDLDVIDLVELMRASVGRVVATLQQVGRRHLLVLQAASQDGPAVVRGVVSQTQIERQLGRSIGAGVRASTFAELQQALCA